MWLSLSVFVAADCQTLEATTSASIVELSQQKAAAFLKRISFRLEMVIAVASQPAPCKLVRSFCFMPKGRDHKKESAFVLKHTRKSRKMLTQSTNGHLLFKRTKGLQGKGLIHHNSALHKDFTSQSPSDLGATANYGSKAQRGTFCHGSC